MDIEVKRLLLILVFQLSAFCALEALSGVGGVISVWHWQQVQSMTLALFCSNNTHGCRRRRIWAYDRGLRRHGLFDQKLLGSFNAREFKGRMLMDVSPFEFLCSSFSTFLQRQDTNMRYAIPVQIKVAVAISRLATSNFMQSIADLYRFGLSTSQKAVA